MKENDKREYPGNKFDEIEQELLDTISKTTKYRARRILTKIKDNKEIRHWNNHGELIYHGKVIPSTQIVDIGPRRSQKSQTF